MATAESILNEQQASREMALAIGKLCPNALFCTFTATPDGRKLPHSKTGVGVSDQTDKDDLYTLDEVFDLPIPENHFWGLYMHEPVFDCFNEAVLTILDVDMKRSNSPSDIRIKKLGAWARENSHLTEISHSRKGRHVIFLAKPTHTVHAKYKLIDNQEIEVFGQPNSPKKAVLLTGADMDKRVLSSSIVDLDGLIQHLNLEPEVKEQPKPVAPKPISSHGQTDLDKAAHALSHISPDLDYAEWILLGQALHDEFGAAGEAVWHSWSASGTKYQGEKDIHSHWKSFHQGSGVSIGSLFHMAKEHGYVMPTAKTERKTAVEDFMATYQPDTPVRAPEFQPVENRQGWEELPYSLDRLPAVKYLIPKFLAHGFWIFSGQPGVGKTTVLAPLMLNMIGINVPESELQLGQNRKVIIVSEDAEQIQRTLYGYAKHHHLPTDQITQNIILIRAKRSTLPDLLTLSDNITRHTLTDGTRPLLILDTANATLDLENENDNSEVGAYMNGLKQTIYTLLDTSIIIVSHLNKQISKTDSDAMARGASAFTGDATGTAVVFMDEDGTRYLRLIKRRYEPEFDEISFTTTTFSLPALTDDGELQDQVCRVMTPHISSEQERKQAQAERQESNANQRAMDRADQACLYIQSVINDHPEGVVMRRGSHAPRNPPAHLANAYRLEWADVYDQVPGCSRGDVKKVVGAEVTKRFMGDQPNNAWVIVK